MTRLIKPNSVSVLILLALLAVSTIASAHGRRGHYHSGARVGVGISIGAPIWYGPAYYPYYRPYNYYPYPAVVPAPVYVERPVYVEPPVYVERDDRAAAQEAPGQYWYYCRESETYYPYVKQCAGPWQRVPAQPADR